MHYFLDVFINRGFLWFGNYVKRSFSLKLLHLVNIIYFLILTITHKKLIMNFRVPKNIINRNNITLNEDLYDYIFDGKLTYEKEKL